jgi:hypothetical protein
VTRNAVRARGAKSFIFLRLTRSFRMRSV